MGAQQWPPWAVTSSRAELDRLASALKDRDSKVHPVEWSSWLARLLVVRSCGFVELSLRETLRGYVDGASGGFVRSFSLSYLERTPNPNPGAVSALLGRFDPSLGDEFQLHIAKDDSRLKRELELMVDRRNKIAHGESENITQSKSLTLYGAACEVSDWFVLRLNPIRPGGGRR